MTFEEAIALLGDNKDAVNAITGAINLEKLNKVKEVQKKEAELQNYVNALSELGFDNSRDVNEFIREKKQVLTETENRISQSEVTVASLSEELNKMKADAEAKAKRLLVSKLENKLQDNFIGADLLAKDLVASKKVTLNDNDEVVFRDGESVLSLDDGIKKLAETRKDIVKVEQAGGTGDNGGEQTAVDDKSFGDLLDKFMKS
jgi:hypothetical protein